jgi:serine/threonine protein kinase
MLRLQIPCARCNGVFEAAITKVVSEIPCPHCGLAVAFPNVPPGAPLWFVAKAKRKVGPFSWPQLTTLAADQQLNPADMVLAQGGRWWQEAKSVPGLFPALQDEEAPKLVVDVPIPDSSEDVFGDTGAFTPQGPLSVKGIKVRLNSTLTLGDFQILRKLGAGGMGAVYLAQQRSLDRPVALKVLSDVHADKETFVNRFHREAAILANLDHPNIVKFIGAGQENGIPFLAMEFIDGYSAALLVKQQGKMAVGNALHIIRKAAEGLKYALEHRVIHRDIKPENVMITRAGAIKIADLGLAKYLEDGNLDLTDTGTTLGSPKYMAPEQFRNAKHADQRSDIFALGGTLYFLLTADEPFKGNTGTELFLAKEQKLITPARRLNQEVPPRLDLIVDKMLAKEPKQRYQSYADLLDDLDRLGLTHERLSFDPALAVPVDQVLPPYDLVEILLIDSDLDDVRLARQALEENHIHNNLIVVKDGAEARAFLRREGKFLLAPSPNLIIFGSNLNPADSLLTLKEIKINEALNKIPLVMLANCEETSRFFESHGFHVNVIGNLPDDPGQFDKFFKSIQDLCLTVLDFKAKN